MANKKIEVDIDIKTNTQGSIAELKELKKQLKLTAAGSDEFKKLYNQIDDLEDKIKSSKNTSKDWVDSLEGAGGPLGMLGKGLNSAKVATQSFGAALKATGIGLIVALIGSLVAAFSESEGAMKKLQPLFIGLQKILGGIMKAVEPLLDIFIDLALKALPYVTKAVGGVYAALSGFFTFIKTYAFGVGKILKGIFTLDLASLKEGVTDLGSILSKSWDSAKDTYGKFEEGTKELTKTEKEQEEERRKAAEEAAKKRDEAAKKAEEKRKAKLEADKANLDAEIKLETDKEDTSREKLKLLLDKRMMLELDSAKLSNAQKEAIRQDYAKRLEDAIKADEDKRKARRIADLDAAIALEIDSANTSREKLKELLDKRMAEELSVADLTNNQKLVIQAKYSKMLEDAIKADDDKRKADTFKALDEELMLAQGNFDAQLQAYQNYENALTTLVGVSEKERADKRKAYSDAILKTITDTLAAENVETEKSYGDFKRFDADYYAAKRTSLDQAQKDLETSFQKGSITEAEYTKNKAAFGNASIEIDKAQAASKREEVALVGNALGQLSEIIGKDTVAGKAFAIAKATIDTYQSAVAAYKSLAGIPVVGPVLGGIAAAAAVATGIATVKKIVAVQVPAAPAAGKVDTASSSSSSSAASGPIQVRGFADGGYVSGEGSETSDSIPSMLSNGEFVMNASSTKLFRPLLSSMNSFGNQPKAKFAMGGPVSNTQPSGNTNLTDIIGNAISNNPIQTYVVANTMSNQQQLDRVIKSRSLI